MAAKPGPAQPVFRFAPSPNGALHLGHAYSALEVQRLARAAGGKLLLRIEDIDQTRCSPQLEAAMIHDLTWIGFEWDEKPWRQSERFAEYLPFVERLREQGLAYPGFLSRGAIGRWVAKFETQGVPWPRDPDGAPHYPSTERELPASDGEHMIADGTHPVWRLAIAAAKEHIGENLRWREDGFPAGFQENWLTGDPAIWGDIALTRRDAPVSYHLAATVDDQMQNITHVVRGRDLYGATVVQCLLQKLLGFTTPNYHHHALILDADGRKLSKSHLDVGIRQLREAGMTASQVIATAYAEAENCAALALGNLEPFQPAG